MKKNIIILLLVFLTVFVYFRQTKKNYYDMINAVSGATPLAVARDAPEWVSLTIDGLVKQEYNFSASALNGFATTRIRTREFSPDGHFLGAYAYTGIPVFNILEGIAPKKRDDAVFDQPLDMVVKFTSTSGKSVLFTFNEIIMADDALPVTLAFHREPLKPTSDNVKDTYKKNIYSQPLNGLRLIAPGEPNTTRYLDNVNLITYTVFPAPHDLLPIRKKGIKCASNMITCIDDRRQYEADFDNVPRVNKDNWILLGHGHGYEKNVSAEGFELRSFLRQNFEDTGPEDFFLFAACDGYRCLFSGREIFSLERGKSCMIVDRMDGKPPETGCRLAPTADFFSDRSMWALAYVVRIKNKPMGLSDIHS